MKIETKFNGEIEFCESNVITFTNGIPGFEDHKHYLLLDLYEELSLKVLQSVEVPGLAFIIGDPWFFKSTYEFDLDESTIGALNINHPNDLIIYNILTVPKDINQATINLVAPLVIHKNDRKGLQFVLEGTAYTTKHQIKIEEC